MTSSRPTPSSWRHLVLAALCLGATLSYVCRFALNVAQGAVVEELIPEDVVLGGWSFSPSEVMGAVLSAFFVGYTLFQLPSAVLVKRWGSRAALPAIAVLWSAATVASTMADHWFSFAAARFAMGVAQAGIFVAATQTIARWYPPTGRAFPSGALASFMSVGGAVATWLTGWWLATFGPESWRSVFLVYAAPGVAWALAFYVGFREWPKSAIAATPEDDARRAAEPTPWLALLTSGTMLLICAQQFCRAAAYIFFATWFPKYLMATRGVDLKDVGMLSSLPLWAVGVGSPIGGVISDAVLQATGSRRWGRSGVAVMSAVVCVLLAGLAYPIADPQTTVLLIAGSAFFLAVAGPCSYAVTLDVGGRHVTSVFALMNFTGNVGAIVFPLVVPPLVALAGGWHAALPLYIGFVAVGALCWLLIDPARGVLRDSD